MSKNRYTYAKASLPTDWAEKTASDIKIEIKNYILDAILRRRKDSVIWDHVGNILGEFYEAFDLETEREEAEGFRRELYAFSQEAYRKVKAAVGGLTASQFVAAVADPKTVSQRTKDEIGRAASVDITISNRTAAQIRATTPKADISYSRATPAETFYRDVHKATKKFLNDEWINYSKPKEYIANVNPRNIAEMNVRFEKYQAEKADLIDAGVTLVYIPPHSNCSKRCQPYQGRVYSLDGSTGSIDGRRYIPIEEVAEKVTVQGKRDPARKYYAGLFSYNCRHSMKPYIKGQNIEKIPAAVISKEREIEAKQRRMERQIRWYKEKEQTYRTLNKISPNADVLKTAQEARKKARALTDQYESFSARNGVPFYRERTRIVAGEDIYRRTQGRKDPVLIKS